METIETTGSLTVQHHFKSYGRQHSDFMQNFFTKLYAKGIDLGNVELKECRNRWHKFILKKGDDKADFIVFYDHSEMEYNFVNTMEMPKLKAKRAISLNQVRMCAYKTTTVMVEFMQEMEEIIKDKRLIAWNIPIIDKN